MTRAYLLAAAAVALLVSAAAIGADRANRADGALSTIVLTERELALPSFDPENTGLWLEFRWQALPRRPAGDDLEARIRRDRAALEAVGFDCTLPLADPDVRRHYQRVIGRTAFIVFEHDGQSWRQFADAVRASQGSGAGLPAVDRQTPPVDWDGVNRRLDGSRLIPIDAGRDHAALRRRYPDGARVIIVPGTIGLDLVEATPGSPARLGWRVHQVWPSAIHVPAEHRALVASLAARARNERTDRQAAPRSPRYTVTVAYGRRHEPWIVRVDRLPAGGDGGVAR